MIPKWQYPRGFGELVKKYELSEPHIRQMLDAYDTIRGKRPDNIDEWETLYAACKQYLRED